MTSAISFARQDFRRPIQNTMFQRYSPVCAHSVMGREDRLEAALSLRRTTAEHLASLNLRLSGIRMTLSRSPTINNLPSRPLNTTPPSRCFGCRERNFLDTGGGVQ